jgi:hypothetical protein
MNQSTPRKLHSTLSQTEKVIWQEGLAEADPVVGDLQGEEDQRQDDVGLNARLAQLCISGKERMKGQRAVAVKGGGDQLLQLDCPIYHTMDSSIDRYKQDHTTLYISLSTNDYGGVPIYLRSCLTIESFFSLVFLAWDLKGQEDKVAAVTVRFDWLEEDEPMVVRRGVVNSFQKMLDTIAEAPVWKDGDGHVREKGCDVRVMIVMR